MVLQTTVNSQGFVEDVKVLRADHEGFGIPQAVMDAATAEGLEKPAKLEKLHLFYGRNRGRALDGELVAVLGRYLGGTS